MSNIALGSFVKVIGENRVFKVCGFTGKESATIPEGWLIDDRGSFVNPEFCKPYEGATSVLTNSPN
jgi:hypothetical protein